MAKTHVIYTHPCDKCSSLQPTKKLVKIAHLVVCPSCYKKALSDAPSFEFYLLKEQAQKLDNEPVLSQAERVILYDKPL